MTSEQTSLKSGELCKSQNKNSLYNDFNISLKSPILKIKYHNNTVNCLCLLDDGRLVSGSGDNSIIIYNKITYKPDIIIKEHNNWVISILKLKNNTIASCSFDATIKLFKINNNNYNVLQILNYHKDRVYKIIELKNKNLVSCSHDQTIIFYFKDNFTYQKDYEISTNNISNSIIQTKENEICYLESIISYYNIYFFDLNERKIKTSISNITCSGSLAPFNMVTKEILIIGGYNNISVININQYKLVNSIDIPNSGWINGFCLLNENMFLTGGFGGSIRQWKIEREKINLMSIKKKADNFNINAIIKLKKGKIATGSYDKFIKIW